MHSSQHMNEIQGQIMEESSVWTATEGQKQLSEKMGVVMKDVFQAVNFTNVKSLARYTQMLPRTNTFNL